MPGLGGVGDGGGRWRASGWCRARAGWGSASGGRPRPLRQHQRQGPPGVIALCMYGMTDCFSPLTPPLILLDPSQLSPFSPALVRPTCDAPTLLSAAVAATRPKLRSLRPALVPRSVSPLPPRSHCRATATMAAPANSDEEFRSHTQQSPLASQRARQQGSVPPSAPNGRGFNGWFPLGYKEGFSQWARCSFPTPTGNLLTRSSSGLGSRPL